MARGGRWKLESIAEVLDGVLEKHFYGPVAEQSIIAIYQACETANELTSGTFMTEEAHDVLPQIRHAFAEQIWRTQLKVVSGVVVEKLQTKGGGNYYTKATCDEKLVLTESTSDAAWCLPRHAVFRAGFASIQPGLFDQGPEHVDDDLIYGIITHAPARGPLTEVPVGFFQIGFPDIDYKTFVYRVDLLKLYQSLFRKLRAHEEIVIGEATAELLENLKRGKKAS
jgi:hypothetical protein